MSPFRLALRNLLYGSPRMLAAVLAVGASLCLLDLFAGHVAGERGRLEYRAVVDERLGHLAIIGAPNAAQARRIAEGVNGVALVVPEADRLVVYLSQPRKMASVQQALHAALQGEGVKAKVLSWQERSLAYATGNIQSESGFAFLAGAALVVIGATVCATLSIDRIERRSELATLGALGMRPQSMFWHVMAEAVLIAGVGGTIGIVTSGAVASLVNYFGDASAPVLLEPEPGRVLIAVVAVVLVAVLAALMPAFKAARADLVRELGMYGPEGW
jgi:hypothetical protein